LSRPLTASVSRLTYTDRLDEAFHLQALLELVRVARAQVRIFPLLEHTGRGDPRLLQQLRRQLAERGIDSEVRPVGYEFQRGPACQGELRPGVHSNSALQGEIQDR